MEKEAIIEFWREKVPEDEEREEMPWHKEEREREKVEEVKAENDEKGRETGTRVDSVVSFLASS